MQGVEMTTDDLRKVLEEGSKQLPEEQKEWIGKLMAELEVISKAGVMCQYVPTCIAALSMKVNELNQAVEQLSDKYNSLLMTSFIAPRDLEEARVQIHDLDGEDRRWPRAVIQRPDPNFAGISYIDQESIDILRSIRNEPLCIRHPAILLAIYRWQELVRYFHRLPSSAKKTHVSSTRSGQNIQYERGVASRNVISRIAEAHLTNLGRAFLDGVRERALPKEVALQIYLRANGNIDTSHRCLHIAWQLLALQSIKSKRTAKEKIALLQQKLHAVRDKLPSLKIVTPKGYTGPEPDPVEHMIAPILEFLESERGRRFLTNRKSWATIKAAFDDWYLAIDKATLRRYRSVAKNKSTDEELDERWTYANQPMSSILMYSKIIDWDSLYKWFCPPTIPSSKEI
jgi:hypothetical protein